MNYYFGSLGFLVILLVGCGAATVKEDPSNLAPAEKFAQGQSLMSQNKLSEALDSFDFILRTQATSREVPLALFYSGIALQKLGRWQESVERFRTFTTAYGFQSPELIAEGFYRLGVGHENLLDSGAAIAAYYDALNRLQEVRRPLKAELLARLAGLYSQMGNVEEAEKFYEIAEQEVQYIRRQSNSEQVPQWLPRTLYNMSKSAIQNFSAENFESALRSFEKGQIWLLKVARFNDEEWSSLAVDEILRVYGQIWELIDNLPLADDEDKLLAQKDQQDRKILMAVPVYRSLSKLKLERGYDFSIENKLEKKLFQELVPLESHLEALLRERPVEQALTPTAQRRLLRERAKGLRENLPKKKSSKEKTK